METHVHAVKENDCSMVPQTGNGIPKIGKFDYQDDIGLPGDETSVHTIPKSTFDGDGDTTICMAAHAVVYDSAAAGETAEDDFDLTAQTAWGDGDDGTQFSLDRGWATYFTVDLSAL